MSVSIIPTQSFLRAAKTLKKRYPSFITDLHAFEEELEASPTIGTDLGKGLRKVRMAISSKGRGKSGGARVITFITATTGDSIYLIYIYDKSDRESISTKELETLLKNNGLLDNE